MNNPCAHVRCEITASVDVEDESSDDGKSDDSDEDLVTPPKRRNRKTAVRGRGGRGGKRGRGRGFKRGRGRG